MNVPMKVAAQAAVRVGVSAQPGVPLSIDMGYQVGGRPYQGTYEFTPGDEEQTVQTEGRVLLQDIVIHKVPQNYGRVSWNGSVISIT